MRITFVTPAHGRHAVTRLALAQRRELVKQLAVRGITATCVVVAEDENLEIAEEFGFATFEHSNEYLGEKVNAGFGWAAAHGSDYVAYVGSDDWMHEQLFELELLVDGNIITGHEMVVVDLTDPRARWIRWSHPTGVPPWLIPAEALDDFDWCPCRAEATHGMEWQISWALRRARGEWVKHDPLPYARVDFKSDVGMTSYDDITAALGIGSEHLPWGPLGEIYGPELRELAIDTAMRWELALS